MTYKRLSQAFQQAKSDFGRLDTFTKVAGVLAVSNIVSATMTGSVMSLGVAAGLASMAYFNEKNHKSKIIGISDFNNSKRPGS